MEDNLARIASTYWRAKARADTLRTDLVDAVVQAYRDGGATMDIARRAGMDRESIRRIRKAAEERGDLPMSNKA
jgi:hypothetical protein